ncbi:GerW family sporulation protein [Alkalibaculum bacchi]|uniref:GerW family sporulation protein n=1 Tax=Alkalibaculum bacchi TaxID=645887 RepID=UPI0026F32163|nr:GerW family sporulation protein [Alkalibaculum bacchi]
MEVIFIKILLILIASSLVFIIILLFKIVLHIRLKYHSNESNINIDLVWLEPFFKAFITIEDLDIYLKLYLFNKLNQGLIGKPIVHENKTFMPIVSVTLGYGSGNIASKTQPIPSSVSGKMSGGALGLGAKLCTDAVLMIDKDKVSMIPVNSASTSQLMDKIPQMVSSMGQGKQGQQAQQGQQPQQGQSSQNQGQNTQK